MALPDGGLLSKYCRDHGCKNAGRVTGHDLMREILKLRSNYGWRHYFYGSTQDTLDKLKCVINEKYKGTAFDYECGNIKRALQWMQKKNLEWLYRLMQDPKRLFSRYIKTNIKFLILKCRQNH